MAEAVEWPWMNKDSSGIPLFLVLMRHFLRRGNFRYTVAFRKHLFTVPFPWNGLPSAHLYGNQPSKSPAPWIFSFPQQTTCSLSLNSKRSTLSSFQDLSGGNSEIKVFCHPGWSDEILGIGRNVLKKLKSLLNLALERVYEVQSGKHFQMWHPGQWAALETCVGLREVTLLF